MTRTWLWVDASRVSNPYPNNCCVAVEWIDIVEVYMFFNEIHVQMLTMLVQLYLPRD